MEIIEGKKEPIIRPNMPELDFVRGLAILAVFLHHSFWFSSTLGALRDQTNHIYGLGKVLISLTRPGWLGVQLFFVLSGFLITGILLDTKERPDYFQRFYSRRALRILPIYFAILLLLIIFGVIQWPFLLASIFFIPNLSPLFGVATQYGPLWTLGVEEQFYLFWPQFARRVSKKILALVAIAIIIIVPVLRLFSFVYNHGSEPFGYTWFVADGLALGALLAIYLRSKKTTRKRVLKTGVFLMGFGVVATAIGIPFGILHLTNAVGAPLQYAFAHIIFAGLIALILFVGTGKWKKIVNIKWMRCLGRISYGLYLIHLFIFSQFDKIINYFSPSLNATFHSTFLGMVIRFTFAGSASILLAIISREYFEEFFLKLKDKKLF